MSPFPSYFRSHSNQPDNVTELSLRSVLNLLQLGGIETLRMLHDSSAVISIESLTSHASPQIRTLAAQCFDIVRR
jgi:hypothetical protein